MLAMHAGATIEGRRRAGASAAAAGGPSRWMSRSVDLTMVTTGIGAGAALQFGFVIAAAVADLRIAGGLLICLHLTLVALGVVVMMARLPPVVFTTAFHALLAVDLAAATAVDGPLTVVTFAVASLVVPMPILVHRGRWPVLAALAATAVLCLVATVAHPEWPSSFTVALATTPLTMSVAGIFLMRGLRSFAAEVDRRRDETEIERRRVVSARAANEASTERARVLHDTVINTLGAIAGGGRQREIGLVRRRCRHDVDRVQQLLAAGSDAAAPMWLFAFDEPDVAAVGRTGLSGDELRRYEALLPDPVARAIQGCVREAVTNATKHSRARSIGIDVQRAGRDLVVTVVDDGVGFDAAAVPGRGLRESIFGRARDHDIRVQLDTAPGRGTRVILRYDLIEAETMMPAGAPNVVAASVRGMRRTMCWTWWVLIVAAGLLTETINRAGRPTLAHLMLFVVGGLGFGCWLACRDDRDLPDRLAGVLTVAVPAVTLLALGAIEFGRADPFLVQAPATSPLFAILMVVPRGRGPLIVALALLAGTLATTLAVVVYTEPELAAMVAILSTPIVGLVVAWVILYGHFGAVGSRLADEWRQAADARLEQASLEVSNLARNRWNAAGLQQSLALLHSIAAGVLDPNDPAVRRRCGEEERYLRQITALSPDSALMSWWFALALAAAQTKSVRLRVQGGSVDLCDLRAAEAFGNIVLACVDAARPHSEFVVSLLPYGSGTRLFVVGDRDLGIDEPCVSGRFEHCHVRRQQLGAQALVEAVWEGPRPSTTS